MKRSHNAAVSIPVPAPGSSKDREPDRELSSLKRLSKEIPLEGVVKTVAEHYEVSMENLLRRSRRIWKGKEDSHLFLKDYEQREELQYR